MGWWGFKVVAADQPAQPLYRGTIDIDAAVQTSAPALELWATVSSVPGAPAYSGGLMDSWPKWAVEALAVCRSEHDRITAYMRHELRRGADGQRRRA